MLTGLRLRRHRNTRPAPAGSRPSASTDSPPDGWDLVEPSRGQQASVRLDGALLRVADSAARHVSRRDFLKRVGQVGLVVGLGTVRVLWGPVPRAEAAHCNHYGQSSSGGACGPSEICPNLSCTAEKQCKTAHTCSQGCGVRRQPHTQGTCGSDSASNCWTECCSGTTWRCCDCCTCQTLNEDACMSCTGCTKRKCICRKPTVAC